MLRRKSEFAMKKRFLQDFPRILRGLEEAAFPLQEYLGVTVQQDAKEM
jgi:hypothetical protein